MLKRAMMVLETEDKRKLQYIALTEKRSMSEIVRELIREYVENNKNKLQFAS